MVPRIRRCIPGLHDLYDLYDLYSSCCRTEAAVSPAWTTVSVGFVDYVDPAQALTREGKELLTLRGAIANMDQILLVKMDIYIYTGF